MRIYLSGRMAIEVEGALLGSEHFPGHQGRTAFAYLVGARGVPVSRTALAEAIWAERLPPSWPASLSAIVSKLRSLLNDIGLNGGDVLRAGGGCYELHLPAGPWIDHEAAADSIHEAEDALAGGDHARAYGPSAVAHHIARRPFLPGEEGEWIERRRERLASILVRALECRAEIYLWNGEHSLAVEVAQEIISLHPFRETGYRLLMRAHSAAGNPAEALLVYERCRTLMSEELGIPPSEQTKEVRRSVLGSR
jgi:SARP family transcriptional regulator, regulator of embCAB operon